VLEGVDVVGWSPGNMAVTMHDQDAFEGGSYDGNVIGRRFSLGRAPTLLTRTASMAPIGFSRLRSASLDTTRARDVPPEDAYAVHVALRPSRADLWIDGRHALNTSAVAGDTFLFDLGRNPVSEIAGPFDILRFYISQAALDDLSRARGGRDASRLTTRSLGANDRVMHGLAIAMTDPIERAEEHSALFIDHIALAFHAHVTRAYGDANPRRETGRLSVWQLRRAIDYMSVHLDSDPTLAQLARECDLSVGYFARAFRKTTGVTPHQWLLRLRVAQARDLLLAGRLELADIAVICGFVDQSHLTRVFSRIEGQSPGRWRRQRRMIS
jgi:AraC family transcriptional regulator